MRYANVSRWVVKSVKVVIILIVLFPFVSYRKQRSWNGTFADITYSLRRTTSVWTFTFRPGLHVTERRLTTLWHNGNTASAWWFRFSNSTTGWGGYNVWQGWLICHRHCNYVLTPSCVTTATWYNFLCKDQWPTASTIFLRICNVNDFAKMHDLFYSVSVLLTLVVAISCDYVL